MSSSNWIVPLVVIIYLFMVFYFSLYMTKILDTNYVLLVLVGLFFPPIWIIMALVALAYYSQGKTAIRTRKVEIVKRRPKKVGRPKKK